YAARTSLGIVLLDADRFKEVNDTCGHTAGDDYIRSCADLLRFILPKEALIFRTGGDEFAAFLPGIGTGETERLVAQLREAQDKYCIEGNSLSVSIGYSTMQGSGELKRHISEADHNMYADKERKKIRR
ncbi:MAG: GGDEF domain-containing protein, partial [Clostridia bacterium]|nr:GGDEF domain-containing protein [Clostridia bacterium]